MKSEEIKEFLEESLEFFRDLDISSQNLIIDNAKVHNYKKGIFLNNEDKCTGLLVVKTGQVRAYINSEDGKEITLYRLEEMDNCIMTASCILKNINFNINLQIEKDSEVIIIPTGIYEKLNESNLSVKSYTLQNVNKRFSDVMWVLEQLVFTNVGKRLASSLLEQSGYSNSLVLNITHEEIAKDIGTAREVVTRLLKQFQINNIVKLSRSKIEIIDLDKLILFS